MSFIRIYIKTTINSDSSFSEMSRRSSLKHRTLNEISPNKSTATLSPEPSPSTRRPRRSLGGNKENEASFSEEDEKRMRQEFGIKVQPKILIKRSEKGDYVCQTSGEMTSPAKKAKTDEDDSNEEGTPTRRSSRKKAKIPVKYDCDLSKESDEPLSFYKTKNGTPVKAITPKRRAKCEETPKNKIKRGDDEVTPTRRSQRKVIKETTVKYDFSEDEDDITFEDSEDDFKCAEKSSSEEEEESEKEEEEISLHSTKRAITKVERLRKTSTRKVTPRNRQPPSAANKTGGRSSVKRRIMPTPRAPARAVALSASLSPIQVAQSRLHVSAVPDSLPCRESEFAEVFAFTEGKLRDKAGGCMYISGVPGTGKTATVKEVVRNLKEMAEAGDIDDFTFVEINGMRLTEPNQAYVQLLKQLNPNSGEKYPAAQARDILDKRFSKRSSKSTVLLVDELDMLWNRKQTVLYNFFDWPTQEEARLIVLAIANTMDLPEKMMMGRVASRLGLTRLQFAPYTHSQLQEIVAARLAGLEVFAADAVQLVARKVASLSGDARRALDICRRATEIAAASNSDKIVGMEEVAKAHEEMFCSPRVLAIRQCSPRERLFLRAVVACFQRSGIEETTFERVYDAMLELSALEDKRKKSGPKINSSEVYSICMDLSAYKLILAEAGKMGPGLKIWLNVSQDDVLFALEQKPK